MRWIAAAGARATEPYRVEGDDCHNARHVIAAAARCSSDDRRRGRSRTTYLAPDRSWGAGDAGGHSAKPTQTTLSARRRRGSVGPPYRRTCGAAQCVAGSGAVFESDARRIGVAPQDAPGRSAAGDRSTITAVPVAPASNRWRSSR
jgi:hypothetical protein